MLDKAKLLTAIQEGSLERVKQLTEALPNTDWLNEALDDSRAKWKPCYFAIKYGQLEILEHFIKLNKQVVNDRLSAAVDPPDASPRVIGSYQCFTERPLTLAVANQNLQLVDCLIKHGVDVNTSLERGRPRITDLLPVSVKELNHEEEHTGQSPSSLLGIALARQNLDIARSLCDAGAEIRLSDFMISMVAAEEKQGADIVNFLIERKPELLNEKPKSPENYGYSFFSRLMSRSIYNV